MAAGAKAPARGSQESSKVTPANFGRFTLYEIEDSVRNAIELFELVIDEKGEIVDEKLESQILERLNQLNLAKELKARMSPCTSRVFGGKSPCWNRNAFGWPDEKSLSRARQSG